MATAGNARLAGTIAENTPAPPDSATQRHFAAAPSSVNVAVLIEEQDVKGLSALPGIGPAMAERIVAKLRRKMTKFALMIARETPAGEKGSGQSDVINEGYEALVALGHSPADAREKIMKATQAKGKVKSVEDLIQEVYRQVRGERSGA